MKQIRVLIATRTVVPIVADILWAALVGEPDMTLRASDVAPETIEAEGQLDAVDALVIGGSPGAAATQRRLVYAHPGLCVLAISVDARNAELLALRPQLTRLEGVGPSEIATAIRVATRDVAASDVAASDVATSDVATSDVATRGTRP